jgi:hypothetical protein
MTQKFLHVFLVAAIAFVTLPAPAKSQSLMSEAALRDATQAQVRALDARIALHRVDFFRASGSADINPCHGIVNPSAVHDRELGTTFRNVCRLLEGDSKAHQVGLLAASILSQTLAHSKSDRELKDLPFLLVEQLEERHTAALVAAQP